MVKSTPLNILRAARDRVAEGGSSALCLAIDAVPGNRWHKTLLKRGIHAVLDKTRSVLYSQHLQRTDPAAYAAASATPGGMRAARVAWADTLIADMEAKEKASGAA